MDGINLPSASAEGQTVEWATAKLLHENYGGRVAVSSFEELIAIVARNALLKEYAAAGKIQFLDSEIEKEFWIGVDNPAVLDVTVTDQKTSPENLQDHRG